MQVFANRLKRFRAERYHTAEDFARAMRIEGPRYRNWERGIAFPKMAEFLAICRTLKKAPNDLLPFAVPRKMRDPKKSA